MRMSSLFTRTLRDAPSDAVVASHQLLIRAGFIRPLGAGIFSYMPLAKRSLTKIENIMREEINALGGQEVSMPVVHPADVWQETGRWSQIGPEMGRFQDRSGHDMVLAMTHEEVVADVVRREIRSWRQLPQLIYHIQTKWRDDPRPRAGLIRVREFTMKDSYSLDADWEGLDRQYRGHYQAYFAIFGRCGLPVVAVASDVGMMGGSMAHEFMYLTPIGEDTLLLCDDCGYRANRQIALFDKPRPAPEEPRPLEKVATPHVTTIEQLAAFLDVPASRTAKMVFLVATFPEKEGDVDRLVFAMVRGDMELNETKLVNLLKAKELRPAHEEEIRAVGAEPGYGSPVGIRGVFTAVDDLIPDCANLVAGANEPGYHLRNVNYGRDFQADLVGDLAAAQAGDGCPSCREPLRMSRGVEVGNIFKLGTRYSDALGCTYLDKNGEAKPVVMGSYGIGSGRLLACIAEEHHDQHGLIWPLSVAPYQVHLVSLADQEWRTEEVAAGLYRDLQAAGVEVLWDDRDESPGVKFMDADLIGMPLRVTVGGRSLKAGGTELKLRTAAERTLVPLEETVARVRLELAGLQAKLDAGVTHPPFAA